MINMRQLLKKKMEYIPFALPIIFRKHQVITTIATPAWHLYLGKVCSRINSSICTFRTFHQLLSLSYMEKDHLFHMTDRIHLSQMRKTVRIRKRISIDYNSRYMTVTGICSSQRIRKSQ